MKSGFLRTPPPSPGKSLETPPPPGMNMQPVYYHFPESSYTWQTFYIGGNLLRKI